MIPEQPFRGTCMHLSTQAGKPSKTALVQLMKCRAP